MDLGCQIAKAPIPGVGHGIMARREIGHQLHDSGTPHPPTSDTLALHKSWASFASHLKSYSNLKGHRYEQNKNATRGCIATRNKNAANGAKGIATIVTRTLFVAPGIATRSKNATRNKCIAASNKCLTTSSNKDAICGASLLGTRTLLGAPGLTSSNKKLLETIKRKNSLLYY